MVWAIVVVAIAVLGVAAWAGTGRLGEMPDPVSDRRKAHIPDGPVDQAFLDDLSLPRAVMGYRRSQVDAFLAAHVGGDVQDPEPAFDVVSRGYDMQAVDRVLDRVSVSHTFAEPDDDPTPDVVSPTAPVSALLPVPEPGVEAAIVPGSDGETVGTVEPEGPDYETENDVVGGARGELPAP